MNNVSGMLFGKALQIDSIRDHDTVFHTAQNDMIGSLTDEQLPH